jgi:ADP-ribose pyrophosphatase YjhB (NUDIX family)
MKNMNKEFLNELLTRCYADNRIPCVDLLIANAKGEILIQKRADTRRLFPGCWEVPGGHVEDGEGFEDTTKREIKEELDMDFVALIDFVESFDWESEGKQYRNFQFLGSASGTPKLTEPDKTTELKWINEDNLEVLLENRVEGDNPHYAIVKKALYLLEDTQLKDGLV